MKLLKPGNRDLFILKWALLLFIFAKTANGQEDQLLELLGQYDIKYYHIEIEVDNQSTHLAGNTVICLQLLNNYDDTLAFQLTDHARIDSIRVNARLVNFTHHNDIITIPYHKWDSNQEFTKITVFYDIPVAEKGFKNGVFNGQDKNGFFVTWSLSESFEAYTWFPCKQVLNDKADSASVFITVPDSLMAASNGILSGITKIPFGKIRYEWKTNYPIAYYLISFSVANYMDYKFKAAVGESDSVEVQNYIYHDSSFFTKSKKDIDEVAPMIELFSKKFGKYPFANEKYGQCIAPMSGGMENQTITSLSNFDFDMVSHELSHQWFGDNVTCADWQDIWLNEGFASYCELIAIEYLKSKTDYENWLNKTHSAVLAKPEGSVWLTKNEAKDEDRIFDLSLTYLKGASIIHMIRHELNNDDLFFEILKAYQEKFSGSVASINDFVTLLEQRSHLDFSRFFNQWYYGEGYPILSIKWQQQDDSLFIDLNQTTSAPLKTGFFDLSLDLKLDSSDGDTLIRIEQHKPSEKFAFQFSHRLNAIMPDPYNWLLIKIDSVEKVSMLK